MSLFRVPIKGWKKCVYDAALFETSPELLLAAADLAVNQFSLWD